MRNNIKNALLALEEQVRIILESWSSVFETKYLAIIYWAALTWSFSNRCAWTFNKRNGGIVAQFNRDFKTIDFLRDGLTKIALITSVQIARIQPTTLATSLIVAAVTIANKYA